jgi:hypothetical protein
MALLLTAGLASAAAIADNDQFQGQFDGGISGAGGGFAGFVGGAGAGQLGYGFSAATPGDIASEGQTNYQIQSDVNQATDGAGNFAGSAWQTEQYQESGSATAGGFAGSAQAQGLVGGAAGLTVGGQFGVAGSAGIAAGAGGSAALGASIAGNEQWQQFDGIYEQQSVGPNGGFVHQDGEQSFGTSNESGALLIGGAGSVAFVGQAGGTVAANNGVGTSMEGHGTAVGIAAVGEGAVGLAAADASAFGTQTHNYEQANFSADGTSFQHQTGTVHTEVYAD